MASESWMCNTRNPKPMLSDNLEEWGQREVGRGFKRGRTYVYLWPTHVYVWQKPSQYYNYPLIKNKFLKKLHGEGNGNPLQYSCLETPMDRGAWQATVHGVPKSWTRLSTRAHLPDDKLFPPWVPFKIQWEHFLVLYQKTSVCFVLFF